MKRSGLSESLRWLPLLAALGLSLSALALIALSALFASHAGIPASTPPLGNLAGVARSYLFRNAVWNTARMLAVVSVVVFGITLAVQPRLERAGRRPTWLLALALTPLFLPIPYASFLWRPLFERIDVVNQPDLALGAVALAQVWRLWPLAILAALPGRVAKPTRTAAAVALAAAWLALLDVGTPLMATGGAPFNETHVWATWAFHTVWVSRLWAHGAVMLGGLAAMGGLLGGLIWLTLARSRANGLHDDPAPASRADTRILAAGAFVAALPVAWALSALFADGGAGPFGELLRSGYARWLANTLATLVLATLIGGAIVLPAHSGRSRRQERLAAAALVVGFAVAPVWYWFAVRWAPANADALPPLFTALCAALVAGISAGLIALWPVTRQADRTAQGRAIGAAAPLLAVTGLVAGNQFALDAALAFSGAHYSAGAGAALSLTAAWSSAALVQASIATFLATFAAVAVVVYLLTGGRGR